MTARPIAYVMEQTLGSVTHYLNLRRQAKTACQDDPPHWIPVEYQPGKLPWTVRGGLAARRALRRVLPEISGVFVHTNTLAPFCADYFRRVPAIVSSDGTPANKRGMRRSYGLASESQAAEWAKRRVYREVFAQVRAFVAWSVWTKQSFVEDYGCNENDVAVIPPGIDLDQFVAGDRNHEIPRILFVGGDFERKGGDVLLRAFRRLNGRAELLLVTRSAPPPQPGVRVFTHIEANSPELRELYSTSDMFVLPTRADCYSLVCMEALAAGLPIVATRVGGIPDMINEGETGHLIDVDDEAALGDALESLVDDRGRRSRMSDACRKQALERFDIAKNARQLFEFVRSRC